MMRKFDRWLHKHFPVNGVEYPPGWFGEIPPGPVSRRESENPTENVTDNPKECDWEQKRAAREKRKRIADRRALAEVVADPECWNPEDDDNPPWSKRSGTAWDVNTLESFRHSDERVFSARYGYASRHARFANRHALEMWLADGTLILVDTDGPHHADWLDNTGGESPRLVTERPEGQVYWNPIIYGGAWFRVTWGPDDTVWGELVSP